MAVERHRQLRLAEAKPRATRSRASQAAPDRDRRAGRPAALLAALLQYRAADRPGGGEVAGALASGECHGQAGTLAHDTHSSLRLRSSVLLAGHRALSFTRK